MKIHHPTQWRMTAMIPFHRLQYHPEQKRHQPSGAYGDRGGMRTGCGTALARIADTGVTTDGGNLTWTATAPV